MKRHRKLMVPFALSIALASSGVAAWDDAWFCEQPFRQCARNGGDIEPCGIEREECYAMNGRMAP